METDLTRKSALVTPEQVRRAAELARLELTGEQIRDAAAELGRMLGYMDALAALEPEPEDGGGGPVNVLRPDEPRPCWDRAELLAGAPAHDGEAFLVPQAVE